MNRNALRVKVEDLPEVDGAKVLKILSLSIGEDATKVVCIMDNGSTATFDVDELGLDVDDVEPAKTSPKK